jgi:hypothetical protein
MVLGDAPSSVGIIEYKNLPALLSSTYKLHPPYHCTSHYFHLEKSLYYHLKLSSHSHTFSHILSKMMSNNVCGNIITRVNAPKYLQFSRACLFAMTRCPTSNQRLGLTDLDRTVWDITTSPECPTPEYEEKEDAMHAIVNRHISLIEEWKGYRYGNSLA